MNIEDNLAKSSILTLRNELFCYYDSRSLKDYRLINNIDLTTNLADLFHRHFFSRFSQAHSGLSTLIEKLKETRSLVEQDINYLMCNPDSLFKETYYKE